MILSYEYEGTARCTCDLCGEIIEIEFNGNQSNEIDDAIQDQMEDEGWEDGKCPQCISRQDRYDDDRDYNEDSDDDNDNEY